MEIACSDEAVVGMGYDSLRGEFRSVAVEGELTPPSGGQVGGSRFGRVTSWQELASSLRVDAEVSAQFGIAGGSAKFSFADKMRASSQFTTVVVSVNALNPLIQIPRARLTDDAAKLLVQGDRDRFMQRFGDKFVRGIRTGGEFFGFIQITATSTQREKEVAGSIEANYLTSNAKVSSDFKEEMISGSLTIDASSWQTGGTVQMHTDIDSMCNAGRSFGEQVRSLGVPVTAVLDDYSELDLPPGPSPMAIAEKRSFLTRMMTFMNTARQLGADIDYALQFPGYFEQMDANIISQLQALAPQIDAIRNDIKRRVEACLADIKACEQFTALFPTIPPLIRKVLTDANRAKMKMEEFIKLVTAQAPKNVKGALGIGR